MLVGRVMNIQKYSVHDGPGIRTTVFLKGCPLNCWWCHNPESQLEKAEILYFQDRCTLCGMCVEKCPQKGIEILDEKVCTDKESCIGCEICTDFCINNARELVGKDMSISELMKEIEKDRIFYDESNGGVTFSGGEPLMQFEFLNEILEVCRRKGINTAVDTSGFASWEKLEKIAHKVDLFLFDIKHMDSEQHKKYTGVPNEVILENLTKLSKIHNNVFVRIPIIPGVNDSYDNLESAKDFLSKIHIKQINLLPYHKIGMDKYNRVDMEYKMIETKEPSKESMEEFKKSFEEIGVKIKIGG